MLIAKKSENMKKIKLILSSTSTNYLFDILPMHIYKCYFFLILNKSEILFFISSFHQFMYHKYLSMSIKTYLIIIFKTM